MLNKADNFERLCDSGFPLRANYIDVTRFLHAQQISTIVNFTANRIYHTTFLISESYYHFSIIEARCLALVC